VATGTGISILYISKTNKEVFVKFSTGFYDNFVQKLQFWALSFECQVLF
jgi:hypothetical protein